jgi:DNA polymerase elongation subunit (family B)
MEQGTFFACSWHIDDNVTDRTIIRIYGLDETNENICIIVRNFTPHCYLELPDIVEWDSGKAQLIVSKLSGLLKERNPVTCELKLMKRLYYANMVGNKRKVYPYLRCCFNHVEDIKQLGYKIRRPLIFPGIGTVNLKIHEHNATPILQLTSLQKIPTAGWIKFVGKKVPVDDKTTHCPREYFVSWKNLSGIQSDIVARPLCMSFDLEVNSSIPSSMPKSMRPEDKIFQISCIFHRQGASQETYQKILLTLGDVDLAKLGDDVDVLAFETEHDLLLGFTNLVQERQPNIIMGYNIFGFDIPYMIDRAKSLYCIYDFDRLGMNIGAHAREKSISWSSSAYKNQSFQFLDAEGRLFVDLLPLIKRDYKMSNYKLDTVAMQFLKGIKKDPLGPKGIFECYRLGMKGGSKGKKALGVCGKYCVNDSYIVTRLFEVLTTWVALCEMSKVTNVPIFALYTQGQQLKVFSQVYRKCTHENIVVEKDGYVSGENDHYVGATVFPPIAGVYDKVMPFDFCLGGNTLVSCSNGLSKKISDIHDEMVLSYTDTGVSNFPVINGLQKKGVRETIKIWLADGTTITSTPDHKFMTADGSWCVASELKDKYVRCSLDFPEDKSCPLERDWPGMSTHSQREKTLAFARMLGYFSKHKEACFGTLFDAESFQRDLMIFSEVDVAIQKRGNTYCIPIPENVSKLMHGHVYMPNCPQSVVREYLGGLFGARGLAPVYDRTGRFGKTILNCTTTEQYVIEKLLSRFGIVGELHPCARGKDGVQLHLPTRLFHENIGFRYNVEKTSRSCIVASYEKMLMTGLCEFLFPFQYLIETGTLDWFKTTINLDTVPYYKKKVIDIQVDSPQEVYDIEVSKAHNFLANGVVAHNCSLYPTTIIAYNLCWSTLVTDEKIPDHLCHVISWWDHQGCAHDPKVIRKGEINELIKAKDLELKEIRKERDLKKNKDRKEEFSQIIAEFKKETKPLRDERTNLNKSKPKHIICCERKFRWLKSPMGVLPEILMNLLDARAATKKEMKGVKVKLKEIKDSGQDDTEDLATYYDVLDQRQLALKVSCNSGYGITGTQKGYLPFMPVAMTTTYMGRKAIEKAAESIQKDHQGQLIYGDSVTPDTPILCLLDGLMTYKTIETISNGHWALYHGDKEVSSPIQGLQVWTEKGFTNIKKVIRHKCHKKIYQVVAHTGVVHVTEDHSLLDENAAKITPKDLKIGSKLLVSRLPMPEVCQEGISEELAYDWGVFFAEGSCGESVPDVILNGRGSVRQAFLEGVGGSIDIDFLFEKKSQISTAGLFFLANSLGYEVSTNTSRDVYRITCTKSGQRKPPNVVKKIDLWDANYDGFVYDLETENHHFSAGIGQIIVHNTDSNYVAFPHLKTAAECWDHAVKVAVEVSKLFPRPMSMAYEEKIYWKFMILTKKRYMSLACERDGKVDTKISKKGVLLQRRDTCDFVRKVYGEVVMMIFNRKDREDVLYYIITELNKLCSASYPITDFIVTKSVGNMGPFEDDDNGEDPEPVESKNDVGKVCWKIGDYTVKLLPKDEQKRAAQFKLKKCDSVAEYYLHCFPAQAQLAYKMRARGQLVAAGSRIEYVITTTGGHLAKQYVKVESSEYFIKHRRSLDIDYLYYLKQLTNPLDQVLDVMYDKPVISAGGDAPTYKFIPHFMLSQYKYRYQVREKMMNELRSLFTPKIKFK